MDYTQTVKDRARELLESGDATYVVGFADSKYPHVRVPVAIHEPAEADTLVMDDWCSAMLGKHALAHAREGVVAIFARGCESKAINRFIADNQIKREQVRIIGIPCTGMRDERDQPLKKCEECQNRNPVVYDELLGDPVEEPHPYRFADVDKIEAMSREERRAFFDKMYETCIRCYACRNACPACTCRECFVDQERANWQGKEFTLPEKRYYGITRSFHTGDRCIECGECERVCPMGLPLMTIMHKQVRDIDKLFGPYEGGGLTPEGPDPLRTFKEDDLEEFM